LLQTARRKTELKCDGQALAIAFYRFSAGLRGAQAKGSFLRHCEKRSDAAIQQVCVKGRISSKRKTLDCFVTTRNDVERLCGIVIARSGATKQSSSICKGFIKKGGRWIASPSLAMT
jgi:hypothetical protein